jgi:HEAT repeat protein
MQTTIALATLAVLSSLVPRADAVPQGSRAVIQTETHEGDAYASPSTARWHGKAAAIAPAPAPFAADDPADSLYRAARAALADGDYSRAADLFHRIAESFPKSAYAGTALYYEAFALYRSGGSADFRRGLEALRQLTAMQPRLAIHADAVTLHTRICTALARQGDETCTISIVQRAESASTPCTSSDDDSDIRIAALNGLQQMDADRALPILRKVLARRDSCSLELRRKALFLISQQATPESTDLLLSTAHDDPNGEVRGQAVFWLSQVQDDRVVDMLDSMVVHGEDDAVREKALFALAQQPDHRGVIALRVVAQREDMPSDLRDKAVFWLGQSEAPESATFLKDLFAHTIHESVKEKILFSISQHSDASDWLVSVALDSKQPEQIRKKAVFWASQCGLSISRLLSLYDQTSDPTLREQVIFALSQRDERAATDALMHIAKSDKDTDMRKKAIFWLGQSSDPRVSQFLQELINQ